jgi:phosphotransferase family enzyme
MLTSEQVVSYLRKEALIDSRAVVMGGLSIVDSSRRNLNFQVRRSDGPSYLVKQGLGPDRQAAISHEAQVYAVLGRQSPDWGFLAFLPRVYRYSPADDLLVLELVRDARTLREHHIMRRRFSTRLAALLGRALAGLHRLDVYGKTREHGRDGLNGAIPWILSVHLPGLNLFHDFSQANIQVIKIIQDHADLCEQLDDLRSTWCVETFIHNDLRWDNCLVYAEDGSRRTTQMKIIDWELANYGDPAWDVGSALAEYLGFWLLSIPITGETPAEQWIDLAQFPLEDMQPAIRAFWSSYARHSLSGESAASRLLHKAVGFGAARLIQTAMEQTQMTAQLTGNTLAMLQVAHNILSGPQQAIVHLLGIPWYR